MCSIQSQSTSNPCSIAQIAAKAALEGDQSCVTQMVQAFKERYDFVVNALNAIPGIECLYADGTFYVFPKVQQLLERLKLKDDVALSEFLLKNAQIAVVPGSAFGAPGYIRLSIANNLENLKESMRRLHAKTRD
jgi:aspartate aminotransferase